MARRAAPITIVIPDAGPLLSFGRVGRLDMLSAFAAPIRIVDMVDEEVRRPRNDTNGSVRAWLDAKPNNVSIIETYVGAGLRQAREKGEAVATGNLGEIAVDEYATRLARQGDTAIVPLVLFEDPDVLELRIARLKNVHLLNTAALLLNMQSMGVAADARDVLDQINALRATPMTPVERPARTGRI